MQLTTTDALIAIPIMTLIVFGTRLFSFAIFSKREPPPILQFVGKHLPPMVMAVLILYCLKDISFTQFPFGIPAIIAIAFTTLAHLWKGNAMISIFGGTIVYMVLQYFL